MRSRDLPGWPLGARLLGVAIALAVGALLTAAPTIAAWWRAL